MKDLVARKHSLLGRQLFIAGLMPTLSPFVVTGATMLGFALLAIMAERKKRPLIAAFLAAAAWIFLALSLLIWFWTTRRST